MRSVVRYCFVAFSSRFEGVVPWMYLDIDGAVTVAIGNLIDPLPAVLPPFVRRSDGAPATRAEIVNEWRRVKAHPTAAHDGHKVLESFTALRLTDEGVAQVVGAKVDEMDGQLARRFGCTAHDDCRQHPELGAVCTEHGYASWPADAQLATLSMAWACGPGFRFPALERALRAGDFATAARECRMDDSRNKGLTPRNAANRGLYENAARIVAEGLDYDELHYYPGALG